MMYSSLLSFRRAAPFFLSALFFLIPFRPASAQETADIAPDPESLLVPFGPDDEEASLPEAERKTWTIAGPAAGSPLHDSGLLGPVRLLLDKLK